MQESLNSDELDAQNFRMVESMQMGENDGAKHRSDFIETIHVPPNIILGEE